jgi:hypothetical protein
MASQRTLPYFPTLVKRYDTRSRGIYARAAALVLSAESLRPLAQSGDTQRFGSRTA